MWKYFLPLVIFGLLFVVLKSGMNDIVEGKNVSDLPSPLIGKAAPEFDLPSLTSPGDTIGTGDFAGMPAVLNVWATWCVGCKQEHGFLMQFLKDLGNPYVASGFDGDGRVGIDWGVYGAPETFLIGADGTVLVKHLGPLNWAIWQDKFMPHLVPSG